MNLLICLFTIPVCLMVEENQKLFEPPVTELGKSLMMDSFTEHLEKSQAPCFSTLQKLSLWRRKGVMVVLTSQDSLCTCPALGKSMPEVMTFSSICHKALSLSFYAHSLLPVQSLELCHMRRRSPLHCENCFHISKTQHFPCRREEH